MADTPPPVKPNWGPTSPQPPGRSRRRKLLAVLIALVVLAGVGVGLLYWFAPPRAPRSLPIWIVAEPGSVSPVPWAAQDRAALLDAGLLGQPLDDVSANPNRDQIRLRFKALSKAPPREPVVVYLTAPAAVDAAGAVYVLPADPLGDHPRNRLPLAELLAAFKDCPARHKLLVLQLTPPPEDPLFAPPSGELSAAVFRTLDAVPDDSRLCLVACGPGETSLASHDLGRTIFGYYLEAGLRGLADGWNGERDGRVTVNELASFVRSRVSRWSSANLRSSQTPVLVGSAEDFTLHTYSRSRLLETYPTLPGSETANEQPAFSFPEWLKAGWDRHDRMIADGRATNAPRSLALVRSALLGAERDLLAGRPSGDVQQLLERQLAAAEALAVTLAVVPTPDPLPTLAAQFPGYALPEPALLDELRAASTRADAAPAPPPSPDKPPPPFALPPEFDAFKAKPYPTLALAVFLVLNEDPPTAMQMRRYALLLASKEPVPKFAEVLLIQRLAAVADPTAPIPWSPHRAALALQTARNLEDAASRPELVARARPALDEAYRLRADAEAVLFAPAFAPTDEAERRLKRAAGAALNLKAVSDQLRSAIAARNEATIWLTGATPAVDAGVVPFPVAQGFADATRELADASEVPAKPQAAWGEKELAVRAALVEFARPFRADTLARLRTRAGSGDITAALLAELDAILRTPLIPAADRAALWNARVAITRRLNDDVIRKDAADDESFRRDLAQPQAPDSRQAIAPVLTDVERLTRQVKWSSAVLAVGGAKDASDEFTNPLGNTAALNAHLHRVWLEEVPAEPLSVRLARIAPVVPATAFLDQAPRNLDTLSRQKHARELWAWHAARFAYETRDPLDPVPSEGAYKFTSSAADRIEL